MTVIELLVRCGSWKMSKKLYFYEHSPQELSQTRTRNIGFGLLHYQILHVGVIWRFNFRVFFNSTFMEIGSFGCLCVSERGFSTLNTPFVLA